jgi:hypothetical protein
MQFKEKLFINIGGTSRSGSTLLGKILSNDLNALYTGEMQAVFYPKRIHHFEVIKDVKSGTSPWKGILNKGTLNLPKSIFDAFNEKNFVVDSSKNSFWISKLISKSSKQSINHKNVLIYKDPKDFAYSILKRDEKNWVSQYINYHKKYFSNVNNFYVLSFTSFVNNKQTLEDLCDWLDIKYFDSKYNYWENKNQGFFGSNTPNTKRNIEHKSNIPTEYIEKIEKDIIGNPEISLIWNFLKNNENKVVDKSPIKYNKHYLNLLELKNKLKAKYRNINPEDYFKN